jgi:hypothetical protein
MSNIIIHCPYGELFGTVRNEQDLQGKKKVQGMVDKGFTVPVYTACHFIVITRKQTLCLSPSLSP